MGKTWQPVYHKNFRANNSNCDWKVIFSSKVVQLTRDVRLCTSSVSFSLSFSPCHRSQFPLRHLWHARNHRLAKIRRPAILRLYCTHLQNKNTCNELITFYPQILVLTWITSPRISHAFLAARRFSASVVLIKKKKALLCRLVIVRK